MKKSTYCIKCGGMLHGDIFRFCGVAECPYYGLVAALQDDKPMKKTSPKGEKTK